MLQVIPLALNNCRLYAAERSETMKIIFRGCGNASSRLVLPIAAVLLYLVIGNFAAAIARAADLPPEVITLSQISRNVRAEVARLSNFVCLETTQRWSKASGKRTLSHVDTLQLEVAHIGNKEVYSPPGSRAFDSDHPAQLASFGTTSSGNFAGYVRSVFNAGATQIRFSGKQLLNGRPVLRYEYTCSPILDRLVLSIAGTRAVGSTEGRFWADAATLQLVRLEVRLAAIPPEVPVSDFVTTIDYAKVLLSSSEVWMPQSADLLLTYLSGKQDNNRTIYTQCREYVGESSLNFGPESSQDAVPLAADSSRIVEVHLPPGLRVPLELDTELDSSRALVGSLVSATVSERITLRSGLVIPKGANVKGRLRVLQSEELPVPHFLVGIEFVELTYENSRATFYARMTDPPRVAGLEMILSGQTKTRTKDYVTFRTETDLWQTARVPVMPGVSLFFMQGTAFRIPAGARMTWQTSAPVVAP